MRRVVVSILLLLSFLPAWNPTLAQTPPPPTPAPPLSQLTEKEIPWWLAALVGLVCLALGAMLKPVFEKIGNVLAASLSKLGSGWGFKKQYLTHLIEEYRGLNIRGLKTKVPVMVELEQVYVSLHVQIPDVALGRQEPPVLGIGQAMAQHERLAILGGPGTGKTTLLAYLTLTYARRQAKERLGIKEKRLPILVPLRQLKQVLAGTDTLPDYLTAWYTELGLHPKKNFFEKALRGGDCLVLLDGLDEVADDVERRQMSEWVDRLVTVYPQNRYIVTSRPPGYESASLENGFTVVHIRDFTSDEIRKFATNWCLAVELAVQGADNPTVRRHAQDAARDLVTAIEANADIRKLAVNPLLLSIVSLVHRYRATLPKRRVDLYAECVDVLLGHWDKAKGLVGKLSPGEKRAVLQPLALAMHREKQREIPRRELEGHIARLLPAVGGQPADAGEFVDEVRERSGLLMETGLKMYAFSHLTFQEYLCARELVDDEGLRGLLLEKAGDEWWQEVTLLHVGMSDATPVIKALLAVKDDKGCSRLLLAGRCIAEAVRVGEDVRKQVTRTLEENFGVCTGELFLWTGEVLADIAGEDSVDFFLRLAHDNPKRRDAALWSLGQMGRQPNEALRERVIGRLLGHFQGEELPEEAGAALVAVWGIGILDELGGRQVSPTLLDDALIVLAEAMDSMMVVVPAGEFLMGDEKRKVHVNDFLIDKYPVTNAQYKRFVDATGHALPKHWKDNTYPADKATYPAVYVSWNDATAYAEWAGKRLPTEEEWEKAARGTDGREYPWGDWKEGRCNTKETGIGDTTLVGRYSPDGDSPYGCADMAGNVWEWTVSEHEKYRGTYVVRGGSWAWAWDQGDARCAVRNYLNLLYSDDYRGFRCVSPVSLF